MKIIILIPIYNDWQSLSKLIEEINSEISAIDCQFSIIILNLLIVAMVVVIDLSSKKNEKYYRSTKLFSDIIESKSSIEQYLQELTALKESFYELKDLCLGELN